MQCMLSLMCCTWFELSLEMSFSWISYILIGNVSYGNSVFLQYGFSVWLTAPSPLLDNIRVMVIVWRLRGNIIRTALCWVVWHNVHSQQHTYMSSSYRSSRLDLSHWDPYAVRRGGCLKLYYCNMVEWSWWDSSLICKTNWFPSVLWHCWFGHMTCKIVPEMTYNVFSGTLSLYTTTTVSVTYKWRCVIQQHNIKYAISKAW